MTATAEGYFQGERGGRRETQRERDQLDPSIYIPTHPYHHHKAYSHLENGTMVLLMVISINMNILLFDKSGFYK